MLSQNEKAIKFFDWFSYGLVLLNIIVVPLFVDRNLLNAYALPKQYIFSGFLLVNLLLFALKTILSKKVHYRKSILDVPLLIFLSVALVSSLFSASIYDSFLGRTEYFVFNFSFFVFLVLFYFILVNLLHTPDRWRGVLDAILGVGGFASILFILKTAFGLDLPFINQFWNTVDGINSSFGLWIMPVFIIAAGSLIKKNVEVGRALFYFFVMILCLGVLLIMGFGFFWWVMLIGLILLLLLGVSFLQDARLGWLSALFALLILSCIFIIFGSPKSLQSIVPAEISLDMAPSWAITKNVLFSGAKNFLVGSGLGTFASDFSKFRTTDFNYHPTAWSLRFTQPLNSFFAMLAEGGVLVVLGFVFILLFVLGHVFSTWFKARGSAFGISHSLHLTKTNIRLDVFLVVVAWVVLCVGLITNFYSVSLWVFWWLLLGIVISGLSLLGHNMVKEKHWTLEDTPQYNLVFSFSAIVVMAMVVMVGILGARFYVADRVFARGLQESGYEQTEMSLQKALSLRRSSDIYHTAIASAYLVQASQLSKENNPNVQAVTDLLSRAVNEARVATELSPNSVAIWENLATMYENTSALIPEATDWAIKSLDKASELEPTNPILMWRLGNNYMLQKNIPKAIEYYEKAVSLKRDYLGAYVTLSSAYELNKETDKAIEVYKNLLQSGAGNNPEILFNFGRLLYNRGTRADKNDAEKLWLEAVKLQPSYSNALYSLGLLYENRGDKAKALEYYYKVKDLNPNNKDIIDKIKSLLAGVN
ncbi:MAG: tetratricopeptide repeat protein [Candidatus Magasanikbacteria bacterium]|nr:tetratricopeptide repeat protein [Candidatus Magasanikbacteria bacterium]